MRIRPAHVLLCLLALILPAGPCAVSGEPGAEDLARKKADLLFRARVSRAIRSGAHWIAQRQQPDGAFRLEANQHDGPFPNNRHAFGRSVLCFYTLADCGYAADNPVMKRALGYIRRHWRSLMKGDYWPRASSYSLSLLVLGLHTLYVQPGTELRAEDRDRYGMRHKSKSNPCGYPGWVRALIDEILDWLMANQAEAGLFRYPGDLPSGGGPPERQALMGGPEDLSNTQYVLLALWAGSRCGYEIPVETLEKIARRLLFLQEKRGPPVARQEDPEGEPEAPTGPHRYAPPSRPPPPSTSERDRARGFRYTPGFQVTTGSMTAAGMSSLAIVKAMLMERNALGKGLAMRLDRGLWDSIAWLTENYDVRRNPGDGSRWHYYYLYGLERACVITGKVYLGEHDWYREGAELLLDAQQKDGRWKPQDQLAGFGPGAYATDVMDTCFALLFLKRATVVPKKPVLDDGPVTTPSGG
jgi:hypothetical protein